MGLFNNNKPQVTEGEFKQAETAMRGAGLSKSETNDVEQVFSGGLHGGSKSPHGLDADELQQGVDWLKEHHETHTMTDEEVGKVEGALKRRL